VIDNAEPLFDDALQVDPSPADHAVFRPVRPRLDDLGESGQLLGRKPWRRALRTNVLQPIRAFGVEAVNPVMQRLPIHSANPRRSFAVHAVQNRSQR
jgi:hypothetical protein